MNAVLDDILPTYRHRERHTTQIAAAPEAVWSALHAVSAGELRLTRLLTTIRALPARLRGARMPGGGLPADRGFIEAFMERGYRELRVHPPWTLVAGAAGQPWRLRGGENADVVDLDGLRAFARPGFVLIVTSFELEALGERTRLSTETRVQPTDATAARAFRPYWWAIRAGSGLIRRDVLHAVRRRAERDSTRTAVAPHHTVIVQARRDSRMRLPSTAHTSRPWRIHEVAPDFQVEDVRALPTPGGRDELPRLVSQIASGTFPEGAPRLVRVLWETRGKIGRLLGWDRREAGVGARVASLRDRLPSDLRGAPTGPDFPPFASMLLLDDEFAAEMANRTVHTVMHVGGTGGYRGQMAVLVKPNGLLGAAYMAAIKPFRHVLVMPALMRTIERDWYANASPSSTATSHPASSATRTTA